MLEFTIHDIGSQLRRARLQAGCSQAMMAKAIGVSQSAVSQIEDGKTAPQLTTLEAFVKTLGYELMIKITKTCYIKGNHEKRNL